MAIECDGGVGLEEFDAGGDGGEGGGGLAALAFEAAELGEFLGGEGWNLGMLGAEIGDFGAEGVGFGGAGGEVLVGVRFLEGADLGGGEVVVEADVADGLGGFAVGGFGGFTRGERGLFGGVVGIFLFLSGLESLAGGGGLLVELVDLGIGLGNLVAGGGGGFEGADTGFLFAFQVADLGELRLGGAALFFERGEHGFGIDDVFFGAGVIDDGLFEAGGSFLSAGVGGLCLGKLGAGEFGFRAGFGFSGGGEELVVAGGDFFADALVGGGLHDGGDAVFLEALDEAVLVVAGVFGGVLAGAALPDPEVGPGGGELGGVGASAGFGFEDFGEFGVGLFVLEGGHAGGAEAGAAFGAGEAFFEFPTDACCFEGEMDFGVAAEVGGDHFLLNAAAGFGAEEEGAVGGFGEGAFAGFVGAADEIAGGVEVDREVFVDPVVSDGEGEEVHWVDAEKLRF